MRDPDILPAQRREHPDPHEQAHPVPWLVMGIVMLLTAFGIGYIANEAVDTPGHWGDGRTADEFVAAAPADAGKVDGAAVYASLCVACHQATGQGLPGVFPPLAGSEWVQGDAARLAALVLRGVSGPIEVRGATYDGAMPAFGAQLDDAQLAALLTWLRAQWGHAAPAVDATLVATQRTKLAGTSGPFDGGAAVLQWKPGD